MIADVSYPTKIGSGVTMKFARANPGTTIRVWGSVRRTRWKIRHSSANIAEPLKTQQPQSNNHQLASAANYDIVITRTLRSFLLASEHALPIHLVDFLLVKLLGFVPLQLHRARDDALQGERLDLDEDVLGLLEAHQTGLLSTVVQNSEYLFAHGSFVEPLLLIVLSAANELPDEGFGRNDDGKKKKNDFVFL